MACPLGVHCVTGPGALWFADEEPPQSLHWFTSSFAAVLYARSPTSTIAFLLISQIVFEALHILTAWTTADLGGGPLPATSPGITGLLFGQHAAVETVLVVHPLYSIMGVFLGWLLAKSWGTPVYLESYFSFTARAEKVGRSMWLLRQLKYSFQLLILAYVPSIVAFGVAFTLLGPTYKATILAIWHAVMLVLILLFWWWNLDELEVIWEARRGVSPYTRNNRFYLAWASIYTLFWVPVIALSGTSVTSQWRGAIGISLVFIAMSPYLHVLLK